MCGAEYGTSPRKESTVATATGTASSTPVPAPWTSRSPSCGSGPTSPSGSSKRRKRAERALTSVVATFYLLGVSTRRTDKVIASLGITSLSKSQVSEMAKELDAYVEEFRTRSLAEAGPFTLVTADDLVLRVREGGRVVPFHALMATGVNADGNREIRGVQATTSEDGAGWLAFFRDPTASGLSGVKLVTSDAHRRLTAAIAAAMAGAAWQRCRTRNAANLMSATPKSSWGWVRTPLHTIYDQPDADAAHARFDRVVDALSEKLPTVADHLDDPAPTSSLHPCSPRKSGTRSVRTTPTSASPRDPPTHRCRRDLPRSDSGHPARRRRAGRATRRMGRRTPLPRTRRPRTITGARHHHRPGGE